MRWRFGDKMVWHSDSKYRMDWMRRAPSVLAQTVKNFLMMHFHNDVWFEEYRLPRSKMRVDFLNATRKFAVEPGGRQHREFVRYFHRDRLGYAASFKRDLNKEDFLNQNGYDFIEVMDGDIDRLDEIFSRYMCNLCKLINQ